MTPRSERPLVSIIVPSYNQGRFIRRTLESILEQDYRPLEVLVIDGASTDETLAVLSQYSNAPELIVISEPDSGVVEAVNKGFARARGEIAGIQSSDDYYLPGAITAGVDAFRSDPTLGFVFGDMVKVDAYGNELWRSFLRAYSLENMLSVRTWIPQPSTFFRLRLAKDLGGWRPEVPYAADTDLWFRMAFRCGARRIDRLMAGYTVHEAQRDRHGDRILRDYSRMLDQLEGLQNAPGRLRRAAAAGRLRVAQRYQPQSGQWAQWKATIHTMALYPPLIADTDIGAFIPGWYPLRSRLAAIQRFLLGNSK